MHRFFISSAALNENKATLTGGELDHMRRALRLRPGDRVTLFDDSGAEHQGVIRSYGPRAADIEIIHSGRPERESKLEIFLAQALGKGDKMDFVVEKATELGVSAIAPFLSSRAVPKLDAIKSAMRQDRWRKIAISAAKQSGRTTIPEILELSDFSTLVSRPWPCDEKLIFGPVKADYSLRQMAADRSPFRSIILAIGPEGGFTPEEMAQARERGFRAVSLGKRILRTETAALAALSIVQFISGDME
jgi:16S rRNA (uracil1498-N3)-methyltransferase